MLVVPCQITIFIRSILEYLHSECSLSIIPVTDGYSFLSNIRFKRRAFSIVYTNTIFRFHVIYPSEEMCPNVSRILYWYTTHVPREMNSGSGIERLVVISTRRSYSSRPSLQSIDLVQLISSQKSAFPLLNT